MECYFCRHNFEEINFRDISLLKKFTSSLAKIKSRKKTGVCAFHQRRLAEAIKRARFLALLPYTTR
jgi:small subunit ribosomal protein S18